MKDLMMCYKQMDLGDMNDKMRHRSTEEWNYGKKLKNVVEHG